MLYEFLYSAKGSGGKKQAFVDVGGLLMTGSRVQD